MQTALRTFTKIRLNLIFGSDSSEQTGMKYIYQKYFFYMLYCIIQNELGKKYISCYLDITNKCDVRTDVAF